MSFDLSTDLWVGINESSADCKEARPPIEFMVSLASGFLFIISKNNVLFSYLLSIKSD